MKPTPIKTERQYDIDILEAQVAIDEEFDFFLSEFLGVRAAQEFKPQVQQPAQQPTMPQDAGMPQEAMPPDVGADVPMPDIGQGMMDDGS